MEGNGQTPIALQWTVESTDSGRNEDESGSSPRHAPAPLEKSEHEAWFEDLSPEEQKDVIEEARARAKKNGYTEDRPRTFSAGVIQMISQIYREGPD